LYSIKNKFQFEGRRWAHEGRLSSIRQSIS
jgi:hypothetical protein